MKKELEQVKTGVDAVIEDMKGEAKEAMGEGLAKVKSYWWLAWVVLGFVGVCSLVWALLR